MTIMIATATDIFQYRRWKALKERVQKDCDYIKGLRKKAEKDFNQIRNKTEKLQTLSLKEEPSEEYKKELDDFSRKLENYEALDLPLRAEDYRKKGAFHYYNKELDKALEAYKKATEIDPKNAQAWGDKGDLLFDMDLFGSAVSAYKKTSDLDPNNEDWMGNTAAALIERGQYKRALNAVRKTLRINPDNSAAIYNRAIIFSKRDNNEKAIENLRIAIKLDPDLKIVARKDEDFKNLKDNTEFIQLTKKDKEEKK